MNARRIDGLGQAVDDRPLARGVPAFEDDDHRHSGGAGQSLALAQFLLQKRVLLVVVFFGDLLIQIDKFQHDVPRKRRSCGKRNTMCGNGHANTILIRQPARSKKAGKVPGTLRVPSHVPSARGEQPR